MRLLVQSKYIVGGLQFRDGDETDLPFHATVSGVLNGLVYDALAFRPLLTFWMRWYTLLRFSASCFARWLSICMLCSPSADISFV